MRKKKINLSLIMAATILAVTLTGCSSSDDGGDNSKETTYQEQLDTQSENATYAKITSIDGNTITAVLGEMASGNKPNNAEMPSGDVPDNGEMPSGDAPNKGGMSGKGNMGNMFTESGETVTFTITDSTKITVKSMKDSTDGSISDLAEDSIIQYELDSNGKALSITVMNMSRNTSDKSDKQ